MKKYNGTAWVDTTLRQYKTATADIEPTIYTDGTAITSYTIKGNTVQNGTPTPSNPVDVQGVGVRTAQLYFKTIAGSSIGANGSIIENASFDCYVAKVEANQQYIGTGYVYAFYTSEPVLGSVSYNGQRVAAPATEGFASPIDGYVVVRHNADVINAMLNTGSTALPYEPYGYKIPISNGQQTTNIYLGSTQTVREIGCIDLSEYNFTYIPQYRIWECATIPNVKYTSSSTELGNALAEKYINHTASGLYAAVGNFAISTNSVSINTGSGSISPSGKLYYALATPETATVNEPLQKIGNYADTLSNAAQIPTTQGANSITVDITVQPSEFTATWTGWHNANVKEWDGSQWNE